VLGNTDLIRPLGLAGIRCAAPARPDSPKARSRFLDIRLDWADNWGPPEPMLDVLGSFADTQPEPPILFFQHDGDLLFVSRNRRALERRFRFAIAGRELVEDLVDKTRFQELALRLGLPVPETQMLAARASGGAPEPPFGYPMVLKPVTRRDATWKPIAGNAKALLVESRRELADLWPRLVAGAVDVMAQELVPGGEERIESHHLYVDEAGEVAAEFTGRKIRTRPARFGQTTACEITDEGDVRELGRHCAAALGLRGVAKIDFKRAPSGELRLLEVNPRFNLWHLPGAVAGVNIPATVHADLAGLPRPVAGPVRSGVRWSLPWHDLAAAREHGVPVRRWIAWQARCETRHVVALDDPLPFVRFAVRYARRRLRRSRP
jgi:predicted ATP-grasp superfamily ATP-dependent carboligase